MDRINLCAMKRDRKAVLELLQRRGIVEISEIDGADEETGRGIYDPNVFQKIDTSKQRDVFQKSLTAVCEAKNVLDKYAPPKGEKLAFLKGREPVTPETVASFYSQYDDVLRDAYYLMRLHRKIAEADAEIVRAEIIEESLQPWIGLPVPPSFKGTKHTAVFIGTMEGEKQLEEVYQDIAAHVPELSAVHAEIVWQSKVITCLYLIVHIQDEQKMEYALRSIGFSRPSGSTSELPGDQLKSLAEKKKSAALSIEHTKKEIEDFAFRYTDLEFLEDHLTIRIEKYEILERLAQSRHTFSLDGYVPRAVTPMLQNELSEKFDCSVEITAAEEPGEEVPVLLKNSWFTEPVENVLEGYGLPGKGELDPTGIMSVFYYVTFGLMFSDAAYGAIIFFACLFCCLRFKHMEANWSKNIRLFMWCGLSTMIWGIMFSSYFGDVVDVVSQHFFGVHYSIPPLWFAPMEKPMQLLIFSLGIGIVHLTAGYVMKGLTCLRQKDYAGIIYDMVFPIASWYPLMAILIGSDLFEGLAGFKVDLPQITTTVCACISLVSIVGIVLTGGRESRNWVKRILKGIYALYSILSGWLSDMLSYSRLLALGLATGVLASVMNQLGTMFGNSIFGIIVFLIIFLVGQGLNFGINVLGAYVHSNRLAYVEFFGKFYDGGGRKFVPFGVNTKHFKIREEN